jgi:NAD(P)-dependent dehydrogenase (short-subunit alcohol dehydrogenase family)
MNIDFKGRTVLITGATRGIGRQIADDLSGLGASLLLTGTSPDEVNALNNQAAESGALKKYFAVDFSDTASVDRFLEQLKGMDRVDGLVNNAGINRLNYIADVEEGDWNDMISVNLTAPFRIIKTLAPGMIKHQYGRIINIASIFSKISKEKRSAYSATKFGIHGLTVGVSNDLARHQVLVNTVSPGFVLTDLTRKNLSEEEMKTLSSQIPMKKMAETSYISSVVIFLLSDLNQYLTGQNIVVDGGFTNV